MLELHGLHRRFGDVVALDGVDLTVEAGELCGFLGPNGAGKTTAMRCAVGVTEADAGRVTIGGRAVDLEARRRTGYMPEERGLYPRMRVHEQLVYLARLHAMSAADATASADAWIQRLGLADRRDDPVEELSLGNQQRVQLAAALVHDPTLLVLDEPFSGLDPIAVDVMSDVLRERADAGVAVVFSSHQLDLVEDLCRTVAVIAAGRVVLRGDVRALKRASDRRLRLEIDGDDAWLATLPPGVTLAGRRGEELQLVLAPEADAGAVIDAARGAGPLLGVRLEEPKLSELFREAVNGGDA
ncbi:MAG: ATP-binding cassette domain-containing protein [Nitriliruptoraceae bacterium]|nr:ATP-binding cassette domain-containing protein [Nitriliruptoraceae bacterium]